MVYRSTFILVLNLQKSTHIQADQFFSLAVKTGNDNTDIPFLIVPEINVLSALPLTTLVLRGENRLWFLRMGALSSISNQSLIDSCEEQILCNSLAGVPLFTTISAISCWNSCGTCADIASIAFFASVVTSLPSGTTFTGNRSFTHTDSLSAECSSADQARVKYSLSVVH